MAENKQTKPEKNATTEISWRAAEHGFHEKGFVWYLWLVIVTGAIVIIALWQKNFFFAIFSVLAGVMVWVFSKRRPPIVEFKITDSGISVGSTFYEYSDIDHFSTRSRPGFLDEIIISRKTRMNPFLFIPIDSHLAVSAHALLNTKLDEVEYQETFIDTISELLRF